MPDLLTTVVFCYIFFLLEGNVAFGASYPQNDRSLQRLLEEIFEKHDDNLKQDVRRQLDFGDTSSTTTKPEAWTGRWFPEKVTEKPYHASYGDISTESWTGRWFPEKVTEKPYDSGDIQSDNWTGKWFPGKMTDRPQHRQRLLGAAFEGQPYGHSLSMWQMINSTCDDGKTNLTVDWDGSPINYTCFNPQRYFLPNYDLPNIIMKSLIPKAYRAKHECMQKEIHYSSDLPTFGTHRPAWPRYGEYQFVPRQRWIHSLEHGAIVLLYHPCAHPELVNELREIVTGCLFRHVITPYTLLPPERPLALVAWGWALLMAVPDERGVINFIREHALHGPETTAKDGQFSERLIKPATILTDEVDSTLCPQQLF